MTDSPVSLRPEILAQVAYQQGKPAGPDALKLSSNEVPFPPLPSVLEAMRSVDTLNLYPDATAGRLRAALGARYGVEADQVLIGNGSVALLYQAVLAAAGEGDEVVYPWRSFEAYPGMTALAGATAVQVPLDANGSCDLDALEAAITDRTRIVIVCTPNNPTGGTVPHEQLVAFLGRVRDDLLVVVDEAYVEFVTDRDAADASKLLGAHRNLVLARTFSKAWGLAGLRVGYLIGDAAVIAAFGPAGIPLSVTAQAEAAALAALEAADEATKRVAEITVRRDEMVRALRDQGWAVPPTQSNFFWLETGVHTLEADEILREHGIIARAFAGDGIRVSVGNDASVGRILAAAGSILDQFPSLRSDAAEAPTGA